MVSAASRIWEPVLQITEMASSLTVVSAPLFLVTLPPEMQNALYEILFKRDRPVLIRNKYPFDVEGPLKEDCDGSCNEGIVCATCRGLVPFLFCWAPFALWCMRDTSRKQRHPNSFMTDRHQP